ncbi:CRTAC1 family protein [Opitutaceae bacterium EW11]|nr:CRTAC1 family protein [Opitutaceae bacterium EW11]
MHLRHVLTLLFTAASSLPAASPGNPRPPTPALTAGPGDLFEDVTQRSGIDFVHHFPHRRIANILLSNGAGGVVFDYDGDGFVDLYLVNWSPLDGVTSVPAGTPRQPNRLYHNRGDGTFEDVTRQAGLEGGGFASAACAGDIDNDGHPDLYVAGIGRSFLFRNRGDGTFEDITGKAGVGRSGAGISAVFLDYDRDGWLDLYVANYLTYVPENASEQNPGAYPGPLAYAGQANVLYRNRGDGTFEDVTRKAGLESPGQRAMSVSAFDCNRDGFTDLYVSNDDTPNQLWLNDGKGHFQEIGMEAGVAFNSIGEAPGSMNATIGDANGDGLPDLFVTRFGYDSLYLRTARGLYDDRIWASGLGALTQKFVGWGGEFIDFDNDGDQDLLIANGDAFQLEGTTPLLLENQGQAKFTDASAAGGAFFRQRINGRGNAVLDFDNDGREDVLITALGDRPFLLRNRCGNGHHWLTLRLEGTKSNRDGYGALLTLTAGGLTLQSEARCPTGFLIQGDARPHFGLGTHTKVDRLEIRWPSGRVQVLTDVSVDQILNVKEPQS